MAGGPLDRAKGDLVNALSILDRCGEEGLVSDVLLVVDQLQTAIDPTEIGINPDGRLEESRVEGVGHVELGEDGAACAGSPPCP